MTPNVIDISHHNTIRDFGAVRAEGILGVILKCTQGASYVDPTYAPRVKLARAAGLHVGAYTFNTGEAVDKQVDNFLLHADPQPDTLLCLDFEDNPHSNMTLSQARDFLGKVDARLGRKCVLYSGNRAKDLLGGHVDPFLHTHRLWLAQYGPRWQVQASWQKPWLWQYSERGTVQGALGGYIDLNFYDGSPEQLAKEWAS